MVIFVALLFVPILMQHFVIRSDYVDYEKKNQRSLTSFFVLLTLILVLRHASVGKDTINYINFFERISNLSWTELGKYSVEWGFSYYGKFISLISKEPQIFLAVSSIITVCLMYPTYKRLCVDPSLTIVLFSTMATFVMMFSGIRQMIAIALGVVAYEFTRNKKWYYFILVVAIAILFHTSAFMLIFMYPLYHAKITRKWLFAVVPIVVVIFILNRQIFSVLALILERFTKYDASITQTGAYTMLILFVMFAVFSFIIPDESLVDRETIGLRNFLLFSLVLQIFAPLHTIAMRMNYYYIIFIPLLIPRIIACRSERWSQVAIVARFVMLAFFAGYFFLNLSGDSNLNVFPYHFFWENP